MVKAAACALILGGSALLGVRAAEGLRERLRLLRELQRMVLSLSREISAFGMPLGEALVRAGGGQAQLVLPGRFFVRVGQALERGEGLPMAWKREAEGFAGSALTAADREELVELGGRLGTLDKAMQEGLLAQYGQRLEEAYRQASGEYEQKAKLYRWLGVSAGLFLIILWV